MLDPINNQLQILCLLQSSGNLSFLCFTVSQVSSGSTRRQSESLTVTQTPTAGTQPGTDEDREKKRKSDGWGEMFAKMFPVVRLVQVQVCLTLKINSLAPWEIFRAFLLSADFFQNQLFQKILSGIPSECQAVWFQIRPNILSRLI